jgi:hypothetical protein
MTMEVDLRSRLLDALSVSVEWDVRPQQGALPAVVIETVVGIDSQHMQGLNTFQETMVQFSCFAATKKAAVELREEVKAAIIVAATEGDTEFLRATDIMRRQSPADTAPKFMHNEILEARIWHGPWPS